MSGYQTRFAQRVRRIELQHEELRNQKSNVHIGRDGSIELSGYRRRFRFPWAGLALILVSLMGIKTSVMIQMGPAYFELRAYELAQSEAPLERASAMVMAPGPVSGPLSQMVHDILIR